MRAVARRLLTAVLVSDAERLEHVASLPVLAAP
jgi:hypothetical protein